MKNVIMNMKRTKSTLVVLGLKVLHSIKAIGMKTVGVMKIAGSTVCMEAVRMKAKAFDTVIAMKERMLKRAAEIKARVLNSIWTELFMLFVIIGIFSVCVTICAYIGGIAYGTLVALFPEFLDKRVYEILAVSIVYGLAFFVLIKLLKFIHGKMDERPDSALKAMYFKVENVFKKALKMIAEKMEKIKKWKLYYLVPGIVKIGYEVLIDVLKERSFTKKDKEKEKENNDVK